MIGGRHLRQLARDTRAASALEYGVAGGVLALVLGSIFIHLGGKLGFALAAMVYSLKDVQQH